MSLTFSGILLTVLGLVFTPDEASTIAHFIDTGIVVVGILATYIGRYRHGDITWYGLKK
jgi:hypothetical protein